MDRRLASVFAGLIASVVGGVLFVVAVSENRDVSAYLAIALTLVGAVSGLIAGVFSRRRTAISIALVGFVPVMLMALLIWRLATDSS
jgi:peptidoglycan/LPS O-acetylase OafA/YrhL